MKTFEQVKEIQERFIKQHYKPPINSVGISRVDICLNYKKGKLYSPLGPNESAKNWCISVGLESEPEDLDSDVYPKIFEDVRVFYQVIGTIRAL